MSGTPHPRHPSVRGFSQTRLLVCGCESYAPGHSIHFIQARLFSTCPPEKVVNVELEEWYGNAFTLLSKGERHTARHASGHAVTEFCAIAERAEPGHTAYFRGSGVLATSDGETSVALYPAFGELERCRGTINRREPGLVWVDRD